MMRSTALPISSQFGGFQPGRWFGGGPLLRGAAPPAVYDASAAWLGDGDHRIDRRGFEFGYALRFEHVSARWRRRLWQQRHAAAEHHDRDE